MDVDPAMGSMKRREFITGAAASCLALGFLPPVATALADDPNDSTAELQAMLDKGGSIKLEPGRRYVVRSDRAGVAALTIHSDTSLDLSGAVLELAPANYCALIGTDKRQRTRNVRIANGDIAGNGSRQSIAFRREIGIAPTLFLPKCDKLELSNLHLTDTSFYSIHTEGNDCTARNIAVDGAIGGGISLVGAQWQVDEIDVRNVSFVDAEVCQGNPFVVSLYDSTIGSVRCQNFGFGVKFQDGCKNLTVDSVTAIGGPNNEPHPNPLVKIQGMNDARGRRFNEHLHIKRIITQGGSLSGLYIVYSDDVQIDDYVGRDNCRLPYFDPAYLADVQLLESNNIRFGSLQAEGVKHCGVWADKKAQQVDVKRLRLSAANTDAKPQIIKSSSVAVHEASVIGFTK